MVQFRVIALGLQPRKMANTQTLTLFNFICWHLPTLITNHGETISDVTITGQGIQNFKNGLALTFINKHPNLVK